MSKLYRHALSGHCHRAELFLSLLGEQVEMIDIDLAGGEHKGDAFRALNSLGQVPVLDDDGVIVADANAILIYLAESRAATSWYPADPATRAQIQRWLSVAANQIANGPAAARLVTVFGAPLNHEAAKARAADILGHVDQALTETGWMVGGAPTIADIALYSYIAHAPEGGVSLKPFANIRNWLEKIQSLPGFVPMPATAAGLAA